MVHRHGCFLLGKGAGQFRDSVLFLFRNVATPGAMADARSETCEQYVFVYHIVPIVVLATSQ